MADVKAKPAESTGEVLTMLQQQFVDYADTTVDARNESEMHRQYYDGQQWTSDELAVLKARNQPPIVDNRIKDKVEHLLGLERRTRSDPKAYPRNPTDETAAEAATDALRFIADRNEFQQIRSRVAETMLVEGIGACEVVIEQRGEQQPRIVIRRIRWDRFYYDPFSMEADFADATYMGIVTWMDASVAKERWPKQADQITESMTNQANTETQDDRPRWVDSKRKRVQVFETYYRKGGDWYRAVWCKGLILEPPALSAYLNNYGETECCIVAQALYVGQDGDRYGIVRRYKTLQDEINHRRSKALHILNNRQVIGEKGAVEDVHRTKLEVAKPDGYIEVTPGMRWEFAETNDMAAGQIALLNDAMQSMAVTGPNAALQGQSGNISGRAKQLDQEGGAIQLGIFFDAIRYFQRRVMRACWSRVQQFWTEEKWIRVRDNEGRMKFTVLNQQTTQGELMAEQIGRQQMPPEQKQAMIEQIAADPNSRMPAVKNNVAELDVDIIIDESPDTITLQQEQFEQLINLASAGVVFPPDVYIEASGLRNKDKLLGRLRGTDDPALQEQQDAARRQMQLDEEKKQADIRQSNAKANKYEVDAAVDLTEAAQRAMNPPEQEKPSPG